MLPVMYNCTIILMQNRGDYNIKKDLLEPCREHKWRAVKTIDVEKRSAIEKDPVPCKPQDISSSIFIPLLAINANMYLTNPYSMCITTHMNSRTIIKMLEKDGW
jgi:hypothetical protein